MPSITWEQMQYDYYQINPPVHAEVAYQPKQGDVAPPISARATTTGPSGVMVLLVTSLYNRPPGGGCVAEALDYNLLLKYNGGVAPDAARARQVVEQHPDVCAARSSGTAPALIVLQVKPNTPYFVSTHNAGTQAKLLSKEQYKAGGGRPPI